MSESIFFIGPDNKLTEMRRSPYDSEDIFQTLLADHPALLRLAAGVDGKLLLIQREQPVPDGPQSSDRWYLDHLFLDRQGVPVMVEVKQASDTRARREVVAQMLDYAANGVAYWPIDRLVAAYRETTEAAGRDPDAELATFIENSSPEGFWRQVESNLRSGRIRMLFVADRVAKELARIIEFLNEQMRPAEVLAIEVEQFVGANGMRTLVPRVVGATERAQSAKAVMATTDRLSETDWLSDLESRQGAAARRGAEQIVAWFRANGFEVQITQSQDAMSGQLLRSDGKVAYPFFVRRSNGRLETSLQYLADVPAFRSDEARRRLLDRIRRLPASTLKASAKLTGWASVSLEELAKPELWTAFTAFALDVAKEVQGDLD